LKIDNCQLKNHREIASGRRFSIFNSQLAIINSQRNWKLRIDDCQLKGHEKAMSRHLSILNYQLAIINSQRSPDAR